MARQTPGSTLALRAVCDREIRYISGPPPRLAFTGRACELGPFLGFPPLPCVIHIAAIVPIGLPHCPTLFTQLTASLYIHKILRCLLGVQGSGRVCLGLSSLSWVGV